MFISLETILSVCFMDFLEFLEGAEPPAVQLAVPPDVLCDSHVCRRMWVFAVPLLYLGFAEAFLLELANKLKKRLFFFFLYICHLFIVTCLASR